MNIDIKNQIKGVVKGIVILNLILIPFLLFITDFNKNIILCLVFGSIISALNFALLSIDVERIMKSPYGHKRNYPLRMMIILATLIISVKYGYSGMIGAFIGLISTKVVIITRVLLIDKPGRKEE